MARTPQRTVLLRLHVLLPNDEVIQVAAELKPCYRGIRVDNFRDPSTEAALAQLWQAATLRSLPALLSFSVVDELDGGFTGVGGYVPRKPTKPWACVHVPGC